MLALFASVAVASQAAPIELDAYLNAADSSFRHTVVRRRADRIDIALTSQTWQGRKWTHELIVAIPQRVDHRRTAILIITGGKSNDADISTARRLADKAGMPVATLFHIPNQPIWGKNEDDLIAHTFEQYLKTGDTTWPLLFPMTKSAIRAMDAVVSATRVSRTPVARFVVTGASKRGWTTWMAAASGDKRVAGIAPMVYDNLNIPAQLRHQIASWGRYSEMISDYTDRGLPDVLNSDPGKKLAAMVDPYAYRSRIKVPTLIVKGANDRYWTVDALSLYWSELKQPKWLVTVPNAGHDLGDGTMAMSAIAAFARSCAGEFRLPNFRVLESPMGKRMTFKCAEPYDGLRELAIWTARANSLDFRASVWRQDLVLPGATQGAVETRSRDQFIEVAPPMAVFAEGRFTINGHSFSLCTPVRVHKSR